MYSKKFSVDYSNPQCLSAFYDVRSVHADTTALDQGLVQGEVVTAEGIQIVRATNIPSSTFLNLPCTHSGSIRHMMALASDVQTLACAHNQIRHLNPRELFILNTAKPWRIHVNPTRTSTVLTVDDQYIRDIAHDKLAILGSSDCQTFALSEIVSATVDSAWTLAQQGQFAISAPKILQILLDSLWLSCLMNEKRSEDESHAALDIRFSQATRFIASCYRNNDLSIDDIARGVGVSSRYLRRIFASKANSPSRYLYEYRLDMAAKELREWNSDKVTITELALRNGFNSSAHFSTEFKRRFGVPPREFRRAHRLS